MQDQVKKRNFSSKNGKIVRIPYKKKKNVFSLKKKETKRAVAVAVEIKDKKIADQVEQKK